MTPQDIFGPDADKVKKAGPEQPRWETLILFCSFVYLWIWWLVRQAAYRAEVSLWFGWNLGLVAVIGLLVWVLVRRGRRTLKAMREMSPSRAPRKRQ